MSVNGKQKHALRRPSQNLGIELTTRCNSACTHCFARAGLRRDDSLTPARVRTICAEGYAAGYRHLHLTGGEPLLWEGLFRLLEDVFESGYQSVFLNTNGTLITKAVARRLSRYPQLGVSISLQGDAATHDRFRGPGAYDQTRRGMAAALDAGLDVTVFTAIGRSMLVDLAFFATALYQKFAGIKCLTLIQMLQVRSEAGDLSSELLDPEDFLHLVRTVALLNCYGLKTDVLNDPLVNVVAKRLQMPWIPRSQPLRRSQRIMIRANGDITLAHSTGDTFGRYQPGMIPRVLASTRYRRAVAADDQICPACRFEAHCRPAGMLRPSDRRLDLNPATPYCQKVLALAPDRWR